MRIRGFERDRDESAWVEVLNAAYCEFRDWRAVSAEELFLEEDGCSPSRFDSWWIAELDGNPVGLVRTLVDSNGQAKNGVVEDLAVHPGFRRLNIEKELARFAVAELKRLGVDTIVVPRLRWAGSKGESRAEFLEELGFNLTRKTSLMEIDLFKKPVNATRSVEVAIQQLLENSEEDVETLNRLRNECSKDQIAFRPSTPEETKRLLDSNMFSCLKIFFALLNGEHVGFIAVAWDEKYNAEKNVKAGIVLALGVLGNYRRKGIGTKLLLHGLEFLRENKMTKAMLDVDDLNQTRAMELYEQIGFTVTEKYVTYQKTCH